MLKARGKKRPELVWQRRPPSERRTEDASGCRLGDRKKVDWILSGSFTGFKATDH